MTENWIEKAVDEIIGHFPNYLKKSFAPHEKGFIQEAITKHAPVIDAEKLAQVIDKKYERWGEDEWSKYPGEDEAIPEITQLITDNMTLDIEWVKANTVRTEYVANFGRFHLYACDIMSGWSATVCLGHHTSYSDVRLESLELAQQACVTALKKILSGVK